MEGIRPRDGFYNSQKWLRCGGGGLVILVAPGPRSVPWLHQTTEVVLATHGVAMSPNLSTSPSASHEGARMIQDAPNAPRAEDGAGLVPPPLPGEVVGSLRGENAVAWWENTLDAGLRERLLSWKPPTVPTPSTEHVTWLAVSISPCDGEVAIAGWGSTPTIAHRNAERWIIEGMLDPASAADAFDTPPNSPWLYFESEVRFVQLRGDRSLIERVARASTYKEPSEEEPTFEAGGGGSVAEALRSHGAVLELLDADEREEALLQLERRTALLDPRGGSDAERDGDEVVLPAGPSPEADREALRAALRGEPLWFVARRVLQEIRDEDLEDVLMRMLPVGEIAALVDADIARRERAAERQRQEAPPEETYRGRCERLAERYERVLDGGYREAVLAALRALEVPNGPALHEHAHCLLLDANGNLVDQGESWEAAYESLLELHASSLLDAYQLADTFGEEIPLDPAAYLRSCLEGLHRAQVVGDDPRVVAAFGRRCCC